METRMVPNRIMMLAATSDMQGDGAPGIPDTDILYGIDELGQLWTRHIGWLEGEIAEDDGWELVDRA